MSHTPHVDQIAFNIDPSPYRPFLTADASGAYSADAAMIVYELGRMIGKTRAAAAFAAAMQILAAMADDSVMSARVTIDDHVDLTATRIAAQAIAA